MNSGITSERVYHALKRRLLTGEFRPGERLDPALLSQTLSSSVTPVRDVLNMLKGECLVEARTGEGFFRPQVTAPDLEDLYGWSEQVLGLAIRHWPAGAPAPAAMPAGDVAARTGALFLAIGARSSNAEHHGAIAGINDRLHAARVVEDLVLDGGNGEIAQLEAAFAAADAAGLVRAIAAYHRRRRRAASEIVRAIYRAEPAA